MALFATAPQQPNLHLVCPVTGEDIETPFMVFDYKGAAYSMCCPMCPGPFSKDPEKFLTADKVKDKTVGVGYFDPVSGIAVRPNALRAKTDSVGPSVYHGVAYFFQNADDKKTFDADPTKYTTVPAKEALYCPVMQQDVPDLAHSGGYTDVNGVRYYICCSQCAGELKANPTKYLDAKAATYVHDVVAVQVKKKDK